MAYWLMKSEPDVFSFDDLVAKTGRGEVEEWHGVRNFTARNNMKEMAVGDLAFFYHSNIGKEIVGIMTVVGLAHDDSTAEPNDKGNIVWQCVDVQAVEKLPQPVPLATIKSTPGLEGMELVRLSRLSVSRVTPEEWDIVCRMGGK